MLNMKRKVNSLAKKRNKKNKLTKKDWKSLEEYGTLNPIELEESEEEENLSKRVFTEDQLDEGIKREEYDKMTYDASDDASDDDDDDENDENAEDIYLDKPNSSYRKLVGLLQVNKKRKVDKMKKENVDINKTDKVDVAKSDLGNKEVEMKYESGLQQESGRNKKDNGEKKEREREGKDEEEEQGKAEGSSNEDDEREDEENEKDEFENHFGDQQKRQQILNSKVTMIEQKQWKLINYENASLKQWHLFQQFNKYQDVLYTNRNIENSFELRYIYALHALNHIYKVRNRILKNNEKLNKAHAAGKDIDEIRDQGFTRPKVLILLPFRNSAMSLAEILIKLSGTDQQENQNRFFESYGITPEQEKIDLKKPADFLETFKGNIDDMFRIGIKFTRKSMKFYAEFYSADIIIASPLGLRMIIGTEGDKKRDFDFLSSIEVIIVDQCDTLLMQNWDHVEHIFSHMNLIPQKSHDCDFSRVKNWYLDGRARYLRQTIILSDYLTPEINMLFNKQMNNVDGKMKIKHHHQGTILDVNVKNIRQIFTRIECNSLSEIDDIRFKYFIEKILPKTRKMNLSHVMIFIPSYFDFVRLRNYFEENTISFTSISEYTNVSDVTRARTYFLNGKKNYLLYTERFHFFRRHHMKGIHHVIFYALPDHAHFYSELLNSIQSSSSDKNSNEKITINVIFSKYDKLRLERVVGSGKVSKILQGEKKIYTFS
ncbi:Utp25p [Rhizophagus irregularis DAOM 197198w]|uniref:U3 small nucleolar RNA-associated protein 25 n=2 Tax=Rhizophagus irregularis (strain DAOM 197198w) TaxID=1432141 RepID=A0A015KYI6_RHIIW|nr:Utp25p [Rhizophagus irregularis DAOM 197198w]